MSVHVCGDTHSPYDVAKLNTKNWPERKKLTKEDTLIILGDYGGLWENIQTKDETYWLEWFASMQCTVCFLPGNHENYTKLNALETVDFHKGKVGIIPCATGSIYYLKRGEVYDFEGQTILTFGGATSTDKAQRTAYKSWWPEEVHSQEEWNNLINNLEKHDYSVDYVLTHTAPTKVIMNLPGARYFHDRFEDPVAQALQQLLPHIQFKQWHFGHFHVDFVLDDHFFCHYNDKPFKLF